MKDPAGQIRLVTVGATGMVGGYALTYALDHSSVEVVTVIGRRKLRLSHPKLREVVHKDFADCSILAKVLSDQDVYCLGVYTGAVSDADLRNITADYTTEFARVLRASSPGFDQHRRGPPLRERLGQPGRKQRRPARSDRRADIPG